MVKSVSVGLLGLGTVGSGVVKIIKNHQDKLMHQIGCPVEIKKLLCVIAIKKRCRFARGSINDKRRRSHS